MKSVIGTVNYFGVEYKRVLMSGFPHELWETEEGKLCRFLKCIEHTFFIEDGMGTVVIRKDGFLGNVLFDGYDPMTGMVQTDAGEITVKIPSFLNDIQMWENFIFNRKYSEVA